MQIRILTKEDIDKCINMREAIEAIKHGYINYFDSCTVPKRELIFKDDKVFGSMPAYCDALKIFICKIACAAFNNYKVNLPTVSSVVQVFNGVSGVTDALIEGSYFTAIRTAATCGLATDLLADRNATTLSIIGSGALAEEMLQAMLEVRNIRKINVYSRTPSNVSKFVAKYAALNPSIKFLAYSDIKDAISDAEIICTATTHPTPLFGMEDIREKVHINVAGAHTQETREIDNLIFQNATVIVEHKEFASQESGATLHKGSHAITDFMTGNIAQTKPITVFSSVGTAYQDLFLANQINNIAKLDDIGSLIQLN